MSRSIRPIARAFVPAAAALAILGGCAHYVAETERYGSLKDSPVAEPSRQTGAPAKPAPRAKPAARSGGGKPEVAGGRQAAAPAPVRESAQPPAAPATLGRQPPAAEVAPLEQAGNGGRLLAEGKKLFAAGEVLKARERFLAAMNGPVPDVMLAFGRTFDPYYLARLPRADASADPQRALVIYEGAARQGLKEAEDDLQRLRKLLAATPAGKLPTPPPPPTPSAAPTQPAGAPPEAAAPAPAQPPAPADTPAKR